MANAQRSRAAQPALATRRRQDITGLLVFFLGAAGLISLSWSQPGLVPDLVDNALRLLAGIGAFAVPLLFMIIGTMYLIGYERLTFTHASFGTLLLFLVGVTGRHMAVVPYGAHWDSELAKSGGGWIGGLFGTLLYSLCGPTIAYMFLVVISLISVVLLVDQPLIVVIRRMHERGKSGARAAQRGIEQGVKVGAALIPGKPSGKPASGLAPPVGGETERDRRVAKVAERALAPAAQPARLEPAAAPAKPEAHKSGANLFSMFSIARSRSDEIDEAEEVPSSEEAAPAAVTPAESKAGGDPTTLDLDFKVVSKPFKLPPIALLKVTPPSVSKRSPGELTDRIRTIEQTLEQFNIGANVVEVASGPSVTRYEIQLAPGIKVNKIVSLADNLAMSLAAIDVRVEAPIPGKSAIGLEVPNATPMTVSLRECLDTDEYRDAKSKLTIALGKDVAGQYKYADLTRMPHLLIGGSTNSGKSVCLNTLIASLLYRATPREVKMLMIDPKRVELSLWDGIPHLMYPVVKDVKLAAGIFRAALKEMDKRYDLFAALGTRNIDGYNEKVPEDDKMPYIVLIVDELADLMMQQGPEIETSICRLAQLARATGIHLVIATQRPSVDIITGTIKANISSRIAFAVASQVDSRTILDMTGADRLVGRGDMLFMPIDASKPIRVQGCYLSETETNALVQYLKEQEKPEFSISLTDPSSSGNGAGSHPDDDVDDQFFEQAVRLVVNNGQASTSMLQRRFRIGYTRAARIVEMMEERGIVGPLNGAKPREICISRDEVERMFNPGGPIPSVEDYSDEE
jgi:S-DNA-T family DNA segregation ATPase FtsK/SpoIIIE